MKRTLVRPYKSSDFPDILEISSSIWEGNDYLPDRIHEYVNDPNSHPLVIDIDGKVVSVSNTRMVTPNIAWLEAMRTHIDYRNQGLASRMGKAQEELAQELGAKEVRLTTSVDNEATKKILKNYGYEEVFLISLFDVEDKTELIDLVSNQIPVRSQDKITSWRPVSDKSDFILLGAKYKSKNYFDYVIGEFKLYPPGSYELQDYINNQQLFVSEQLGGTILIHPSNETDNQMIIGITGQDTIVLETGLQFILGSDLVSEGKMKIFHPSTFDTQLSVKNRRHIRYMRKHLE